MKQSRRTFFKTGSLAAAGLTLGRLTARARPASFVNHPHRAAGQLVPGPFEPTIESLSRYKYPEWFRDAKFGFWSHWGPQAVPRHGDWFARQMYVEGSDDYKYHLAHYGHPSRYGYKDIIPLWKAQRWQPEKLMALYKKAGAKYFVSMEIGRASC